MTDFFICDKCNSQFKIGDGGFLGSMDDFEFQMSTEDKQNKELIECSPFMNYVQLCPKCYNNHEHNNK